MGGVRRAWMERRTSDKGFLGFMVPTMLYVIAAITGLIWAGIHSIAESSHPDVHRTGGFAVLYAVILGGVGIFAYSFTHALSKFVATRLATVSGGR